MVRFTEIYFAETHFTEGIQSFANNDMAHFPEGRPHQVLFTESSISLVSISPNSISLKMVAKLTL
jgi:hypothetical protein